MPSVGLRLVPLAREMGTDAIPDDNDDNNIDVSETAANEFDLLREATLEVENEDNSNHLLVKIEYSREI